MLEKYIENKKSEIIEQTQKLIQIPSVLAYSKNPSYPFGDSINEALKYMLNLGKALGFRTKNIDN